jgi:hypothetical protein
MSSVEHPYWVRLIRAWCWPVGVWTYYKVHRNWKQASEHFHWWCWYGGKEL